MGVYDTTQLIEVMQTEKTIPTFWGQFFPRQFNFETESIAFDKISKDYRRMAPFVAPNVQGVVQRQYGYATTDYKPAYIKIKDVIDPNTNFFQRTPGEAIGGGTLSPQQRLDTVVAELTLEQRRRIDNRLEWMQAKAAIEGQLTISGDNYPTTTIDFNRDPTLEVVLTGTAKWDSSAPNPLGDIASLRRKSKSLSGATNHKMIFGIDAAELFIKYITTTGEKLIDKTLSGSNTAISMVIDGFDGVEYMGSVQGSNGASYDCFVYSGKVMNESGVEEDLMSPSDVVGISPMFDGARCFGAIREVLDLYPYTYYPKTYEVEDPSALYLLTQSAPLTVPGKVNATFRLTVK